MKLRNAIFTTVFSAGLANCACSSSDGTSAVVENDVNSGIKVENLGDVEDNSGFSIISEIKEDTIKETSICLMQDENSHTYTGTLESIEDPENTTLEFPVSHLFQKYGNRPHPLAVRGIKKNFRSLLGEDGIENLSAEIPQKLSHRAEKVTSDTQYEAGDTLRFTLMNPLLEGAFPKYLTDQLKESGFKGYSDPNSATLSKRISNKKEGKISNNGEFIYDVVVKKVEGGKSALALYRDGELFMTCYVSAGLKSRKTKRGQFKIILKNPYYFSKKYKSPMPECLIFDELGFGLHHGYVTGYFLSHGCIRQTGMNAMILYSCLENSNNADIFIDDNLYK